MSNRRNFLAVLALMAGCAANTAVAMGPAAVFVVDLLKQVAVSVMADLVKDSVKGSGSAPATSSTQNAPGPAPVPVTETGNADDLRRVRAMVERLIDANAPLSDVIGLYAPRVDFFRAGVVDHDFIRRDRARFEARWPQRKHVILSIDEIAVDPQRKFAFARYTIEFHVARAGDEKHGITRLMVAIGNFDSQPRIHAVREVVKHY